MNTEAVMCMALTRQSPSRIPLVATASSTCPVMLMKARRAGVVKVSTSRCDFIQGLPVPLYLPSTTSEEGPMSERETEDLQGLEGFTEGDRAYLAGLLTRRVYAPG